MGIDLALELLLALLAKTSEISALIAQARAEGRDTLTPEEWSTITAADDAARARLADAITKAETEGR